MIFMRFIYTKKKVVVDYQASWTISLTWLRLIIVIGMVGSDKRMHEYQYCLGGGAGNVHKEMEAELLDDLEWLILNDWNYFIIYNNSGKWPRQSTATLVFYINNTCTFWLTPHLRHWHNQLHVHSEQSTRVRGNARTSVHTTRTFYFYSIVHSKFQSKSPEQNNREIRISLHFFDFY